MARYTIPYGIFLTIWFGQLFYALIPSWSDGSYYDYGFIAPIALAFIFATRWNERDLPDQEIETRLIRLAKSPVTWLILVPLLVALLPLRLVETVEPDWRAPLYLHAAICLAFLAFCQSFLFGKSSLISLLSFAVVLGAAIPLPTFVETSLIRGLTNQVTEVAAYTARWSGIPVTVTGDMLLLENIPLHVAEGCSGIRSFQSSVFVSLLLGELLRLGILRRIFLVGAGVLIAFVSNCFRVGYLVRYADTYGGENLDKLHDDTGMVSLLLTFVALFLVGFLLRKRIVRESNPA